MWPTAKTTSSATQAEQRRATAELAATAKTAERGTGATPVPLSYVRRQAAT